MSLNNIKLDYEETNYFGFDKNELYEHLGVIGNKFDFIENFENELKNIQTFFLALEKNYKDKNFFNGNQTSILNTFLNEMQKIRPLMQNILNDGNVELETYLYDIIKNIIEQFLDFIFSNQINFFNIDTDSKDWTCPMIYDEEFLKFLAKFEDIHFSGNLLKKYNMFGFEEKYIK